MPVGRPDFATLLTCADSLSWATPTRLRNRRFGVSHLVVDITLLHGLSYRQRKVEFFKESRLTQM